MEFVLARDVPAGRVNPPETPNDGSFTIGAAITTDDEAIKAKKAVAPSAARLKAERARLAGERREAFHFIFSG